jgi:hypothetical protein
MENPHAEDLVIAYVPQAGVVFMVDLYNPNPAADSLLSGALVLNDAISELGLDVTTIAGGHGGAIELADFEALLGQ